MDRTAVTYVPAMILGALSQVGLTLKGTDSPIARRKTLLDTLGAASPDEKGTGVATLKEMD